MLSSLAREKEVSTRNCSIRDGVGGLGRAPRGWTWEGPAPKDGLTSFWRFVVLCSMLWIDFSSSLLFLRLVSSIFYPLPILGGCKEDTGVHSANALSDKMQMGAQLSHLGCGNGFYEQMISYSLGEMQLSTP